MNVTGGQVQVQLFNRPEGKHLGVNVEPSPDSYRHPCVRRAPGKRENGREKFPGAGHLILASPSCRRRGKGLHHPGGAQARHRATEPATGTVPAQVLRTVQHGGVSGNSGKGVDCRWARF